MKNVGIVGMPYSGKTTLFRALTAVGGVGGGSHQAVVDVPDPRPGVLADLVGSKRAVQARVGFLDVPGGLTAQGIGDYRQTDALCIVLRAFGPDADPASELAAVGAELLLADLASVEAALEKARKRARGSDEGKTELAALEAAHSLLEDERPLRDGDLGEISLKVLRGFGLLTLKPWIVVANIGEEEPPLTGLLMERPAGRSREGNDALAINAALEAEVAGMELRDARELLQGFGISEPGLQRVIEACYRALDLVTFLTATEEESRAWEVRRGATAPEAAGVIHSDLQRGFIRAEVVTFEELVAAGSWDAAKSEGKLRVEGKDYAVEEGDVIYVRFAV